MHSPARRWTFLVLSTTCIGCDRVTMHAARVELQHAEPIELVGGIVRLEYAENTGAFLGLGSGLPSYARFWLLVVGTSAMLAVVAWLLLRGRLRDRGCFVGLSLVLAGGLGNLFDRLTAGFVVDFIGAGVGGLRTGIFNVADVAITAGALLMLLGTRAADPSPHGGAPAHPPSAGGPPGASRRGP